MLKLLLIAGAAALLTGCVAAPPYYGYPYGPYGAYDPYYGYAYGPYPYYYPYYPYPGYGAVSIGFWGGGHCCYYGHGGYYHHGGYWHGGGGGTGWHGGGGGGSRH
ncbi:hypothetical protein [Paraburkholderia humisilvae]|uniref:Glycine-rich protein n=1 Tax=Paraburkholderia humisilvae TaxID=627669 RepID=A0A6J5E745_9BURK|nr:hypothetical protein [Paraburkholderia humisilvae]CAB3762319.1 hypothetical protein LMG29542_04327 [Paraburkholderia humisilvae]